MNRYRAYYSEASHDPYQGTYLPILSEYNTNANSPQDLRNKVYTTGNSGSAVGHFLLVRDPNTVGDGPGRIISYHRATRHDAIIGKPSPFDSVGYSFLGDVNGNQPPITVILPDDLFNTSGTTQVPTPARIDQLLGANQNVELLGPFNAGDPDIEPVTIRKIMYAPPKYMLMAMDVSLTPREAWLQIRGAIVADGKEADCEELINWLRVCLTRRAATDQPRTTVDPPTGQVILDPRHTTTFQSYRLNILHQDLPELSPNQMGAAASAISTNIADLVTETRRTRQEADARRDQDRVKPVPIQVLRHIASVASKATDDHTKAIGDMITLAFFFLLRPGEYTGTKSDTTPFRIRDIGVFIGNQRINPLTAPIEHLWNATFVTLEFTTQKNGVRGEVIGLGRSGTTELCPVFAMIRRLVHLRTHGAPDHTPIATYFDSTSQQFSSVTPTDITSTLRFAATILGTHLGFLPKDVTARSLRASGAMALLCGHVDTDIIRLLGRWRSDEMLRYLHLQAAPLMKDFASIMIKGGHFTLHPNHEVPIL